MSSLSYHAGYRNQHRSEAVAGAVPRDQNTPAQPPFGLFAEQINGTGFTVERQRNRRVWLYRLRPAIHRGRYELLASPPPAFRSDFSDAIPSPEPVRYRPLAPAGPGVDLIDGMRTYAGAGDPTIKRGVAIHTFAASVDMERSFSNIDGDLLLAPHRGRLHIQTELGLIDVSPGEIVILPRGIRWRAALPDGAVQGFASELYDGHYELPERGIIGANGLADERHFMAPHAAFEDKATEHEIIVKQGGRFWRTIQPHSPYDVVGWHGNYAPFKYDLMAFQSFGSVSWDHVDPSLLTVLTAPMDTHGRNAIDVAVFRGRWDVTEHTFRPPFLHRNSAVEFNAVLKSQSTGGAYPQGAFSFTPYLTPHGVPPHHYHRAAEGKAKDTPHRLSDEELWLQFESTYALKVVPGWHEDPARDTGFLDTFQDWPAARLP